MPTKIVANSAPIQTSTVCALATGGSLKAGTPLETASVPVSATEPDANARKINNNPSAWNSPPSAPQKGSGNRINTDDDYHPTSVVQRFGKLWVAHHVSPQIGPARCSIQWAQLQPDGTRLQVWPDERNESGCRGGQTGE